MNQSPQAPRVLIFGASGGIGSALARQLAARGCQLSLVAREQRRLVALAAELQAEAFNLDATDSKAVERCVAEVSEKHGRVDGVVNCAGSLLLKPAHLTTDAEWMAVLGANLTSAFNILRSATARMMKTGGGSIVLMSSAVARRGMMKRGASRKQFPISKQFPGLTAEHHDSEHNPAGILLCEPVGPDQEICAEIKAWLASNREKHC